MRLDGKIALVTGGASGIGQATAAMFAKEGATVVIADVNAAGGSAAAESIRRGGGQATFVAANVALPGDAQRMVDATMEQHGRIDILFNCAGILGKEGPVEETTEENYNRIMSINLGGVFWGCKYAVPHMKRQGRGNILNMASLGGLRARSGDSIYSASKAGVVLLTRVMAKELAPFNIRVNCLCPITVQTPLLDAWPPGAIEASAKRIPLGRICQPEDIAYAALFLASDESSMITAVSLVIDGGFSA